MEGVPKNCTKYKTVTDNTTSQTMQGNTGDNASVSSGNYSNIVEAILIYPRNVWYTVYEYFLK